MHEIANIFEAIQTTFLTLRFDVWKIMLRREPRHCRSTECDDFTEGDEDFPNAFTRERLTCPRYYEFSISQMQKQTTKVITTRSEWYFVDSCRVSLTRKRFRQRTSTLKSLRHQMIDVIIVLNVTKLILNIIIGKHWTVSNTHVVYEYDDLREETSWYLSLQDHFFFMRYGVYQLSQGSFDQWSIKT